MKGEISKAMANSTRINPRCLQALAALLLIAAVLCIYWQVQDFKFIHYDDMTYITENPRVKSGLTVTGAVWAFSDIHTGYWHPLTWLSHMLDWQLFRGNAGGHHWINVLIHIVNVLLLWIVLRRMTGEIWKSAFVAALFAVHPLNVESVAWIAERKNVLSTLFWLLTLWGYVFYAERPGVKRYVPVVLAFVLGLMTKPMLVTLPFVMLLLDYWPLRRFQTHSGQNQPDLAGSKKNSIALKRFPLPFLLEKIPLFLLSLAASIFTFWAAHHEGAVPNSSVLSLDVRVIHATLSYVRYLGKMIWPQNLAVFYPYPEVVLIWHVIAAALILLGVTAIVMFTLRRYPYLAVGWFWYLGTLFPVIGLVQAGEQAMADRYAYVPLIGVFIMIAWGIPELLNKRVGNGAGLPAAACGIVCFLGITAFDQTAYWRDSVSLFTHASRVTRGNYLAHNNLGIALAEQGKWNEALMHHRLAFAMKPKNALFCSNIGNVLTKQGKYDEAIAHFRKALWLNPNDFKTYNNLGIALAGQGDARAAIESFQKALSLEPGDSNSWNNLGQVFLGEGKLDAAKICFAKAIENMPDDADAHNNMGLVLAREGKKEEALTSFLRALKICPDFSQARNNLFITFKSIKSR